MLSSFNDWGGLRKWDDQAYLTAIENEDLWATMAWSGDIINDQLYYPEFASFRFAAPDAGTVVWTDNMMIPSKAENPLGAIQLMDHYYKPEIAAMLTEWNAYVSPVPAGGEIVKADADAASGGDRKVLNTIAESPYVFPTDELNAKLHSYRVLEGDEVHAVERPVPSDLHDLRRRGRRAGKVAAPYALLAPGGLWLIILFIVPMIAMASVALQEGSALEGYRLTWHFANFSDAISQYWVYLIDPSGTGRSSRSWRSCSPTRSPTGSPSTEGGSSRSSCSCSCCRSSSRS